MRWKNIKQAEYDHLEALHAAISGKRTVHLRDVWYRGTPRFGNKMNDIVAMSRGRKARRNVIAMLENLMDSRRKHLPEGHRDYQEEEE